MQARKVIAITGGIGSGKSVVSQVLKVLGYDVYDCDTEAKRLMNTPGSKLQQKLIETLGGEVVTPQGEINKPFLANLIFSNPDVRNQVNAIVHPAVLEDIKQWAHSDERRGDVVWVETALLREGKIDTAIDECWVVECPSEIRAQRIMARNSLTLDEAMKRIASQPQFDTHAPFTVRVITNDGFLPLLPQILSLL